LYGTFQEASSGTTKNWFATGSKPSISTLPSDYPYTITILAYPHARSDSGDYACSAVLSDVLASQRADIYGLCPMERLSMPDLKWARLTVRQCRLAYAVTPTTADASAMEQTLRSIIDGYARNGVPPDLVSGQAQRGGVL